MKPHIDHMYTRWQSTTAWPEMKGNRSKHTHTHTHTLWQANVWNSSKEVNVHFPNGYSVSVCVCLLVFLFGVAPRVTSPLYRWDILSLWGHLVWCTQAHVSSFHISEYGCIRAGSVFSNRGHFVLRARACGGANSLIAALKSNM